MIELGSYCRNRGLTENGSVKLASLAAIVLKKNLPKELQLSGFTGDALSDEQLLYCALDVFCPSEIFKTAKTLPVLDVCSLQEGDNVVLYTQDSSKHAAHATFISYFVHGTGARARDMCKIRVKELGDIKIPNSTYDIVGTKTNLSSLHLPAEIDVLARLIQPFVVAIKPPVLRNVTLYNPFDASTYVTLNKPPNHVALDHLNDLYCNTRVQRGDDYVNTLLSIIWSHGLLDSTVDPGEVGATRTVNMEDGLFSDAVVVPDSWESFSSDNATLQHCLNLAQEHASLGFSRKIPRVQSDVFHDLAALGRNIPKNHPLLAPFMFDVSNAILCLDKDDVNNISLFAKMNDQTFLEVFMAQRKWTLQRTKRFTPPIPLQFARVCLCLKTYCHLVDPKTGRPLFASELAFKDAASFLKKIRLGYIQDLPDIKLYVMMGKDEYDLNLYRCLRGTSQMEGGFHSDIIGRIVMSHNMGPKFTQFFQLNHANRFNTKV